MGTAALLIWQIVRNLTGDLDVSTDIVGYPTFYDFDYGQYFQTYALIVVAFPAMALAIYAFGARVLRISRRDPLRLAAPDEGTRSTSRVGSSMVGYALVVGAGFGVACAIVAYPRTGDLWWVTLGVTVAYALTVYAIAWIVSRSWTPSLDDAAAMVVALTAPFALLGVYALSEISSVEVFSTGSVQHYPWFPLWAAIAATVIVLVTVARALFRGDRSGNARVARSTVLYLSAPLLLFLMVAQLPPSLPAMDMFHEGEGLVGAHLTLAGALPWRDVLSIHGTLEDVFRSMVGLVVFENSRWGSVAGQLMILIPLYWYLNYLLWVRLFRRSWMAVAAALLLTASVAELSEGLFYALNFRMLLVPVVLLQLARLLDRNTWPRAAALSSAALVAFILTPETAYLVAAVAVTLVAFEWLHRNAGDRWWQAFVRIFRCAVSGIVGLAVFGVYLVATGSLTRYIDYFRTFASGHQLTGTFPIEWQYWEFDFAAYGTVVLVLVAAWYLIANLRARRTISTNDWTMVALAVFVALYYQKFLSRADVAHLFQVWAVALPLLYYEVYKVASWGSDRLAARAEGTTNARRFVVQLPFVLVLAFVFLFTRAEVVLQFEKGPDRFRMPVAEPAQLAREGYVIPGLSAAQSVTDLRRALDVVMGPGDKLFDFTNQPGVFYYLLDHTPPTRFYHVSTAIRQDTQRELIRELRKSDPDVVVYDADHFGLPTWDGIPNSVRHYDVSRYLLDHYRPFLAFDGYTLLAKRGRTIPKEQLDALSLPRRKLDGLAFPAHECAWGYTPNFFSVEPAAGAERTAPLATASVPGGSPNTVRVTVPSDARRYGWLEVESSRALADDAFVLTDSSDPTHAITFKTLPRSGRRVRVKLSNCSQWRGFDPASITLSHTADQGDLSIRLVE